MATNQASSSRAYATPGLADAEVERLLEDLARLEIGNPDAERLSQLIIERLADYVTGLQRTSSK